MSETNESSDAGDEPIPVVNFRPILPGTNPNLFRSSAPEAAAVKAEAEETELDHAERFILKEVDMILDLRGSEEGDVSLKDILVGKSQGGAFEVHTDGAPETFKEGQRYILRVDYLGGISTILDYVDQKWLALGDSHGLDKKQLFMRRRESFNSRGLAGMNTVLLERKDSMLRVLTLITQYLEDVPDGKILVHCTAGKDRTGMTCMLLQFVAGFSDEEIVREYIISESEAKHIMARAIKNHRDSFIDPEIMSGASKEGIVGALEHLRTSYGSVEGYLDEIGFDETWRERLKKALVKQ